MNTAALTCLVLFGLVASPASAAAQTTCAPGWVPQQFGEAPGLGHYPVSDAYDLVVHDDGSGEALYAGGEFFEAGASGATRVARWDGSRWSALPGNSKSTHALAVFDDGTGPALYAGPWFSNIIGMQRWDGTQWTTVGPGLGGFVEDMVAFDDGTGPALYVAGDLNLAGGITAGIARWDGTQWDIPGGGVDDTVRALLVADFGGGPKLYLGGDFGLAGGTIATGLAAWDGTSWTAPGSLAGTNNGDVFSLAQHDFGNGPELVVGGSFNQVSGVAAAGIARWDGTTWAPVGTGVVGTVTALASFNEGFGPQLVAAGDLSMAGGHPVSRIARWDGASWQALATGLDGDCYTLAVHDAGAGPTLFAGGFFKEAGGQVAICIASWRAGSWRALGEGFDEDVLAAVMFDDGSGPALYVGGSFSSIGGVAISHIARFDGAHWSTVGTGGPLGVVRCLIVHDDGAGPELYAGSNDVRRWDGTSWEALPGIGGEINAFAVYDGPGVGGPLLHAAGKFGAGVYNNIARLYGTAWLTLGQGLTISANGGEVFDLAVHDDGSGEALYAGGDFSNTGLGTASQLTLSNIARWNGIAWSALAAGSSVGFLPGGNDHAEVTALESFDDGTGSKLYAKGGFVGVPGNVGVWDGTSWGTPAFGTTLYDISEMTVHDDGSGSALYMNGRLTPTGGSAGTILARFDGQLLTLLQEGIQGSVEALLSVDLGQGPEVLVGGSFQHLADAGDSYLALWRTCTASWEDLGGGSPGSAGTPALTGSGALTAGSSTSLALADAPPAALMLAWVSFAPVPFAAVGGTVYAFPYATQLFFAADGLGEWSVNTAWPGGLPPGTEVWFQMIVQDGSVVDGLTLSNGLKATAE